MLEEYPCICYSGYTSVYLGTEPRPDLNLPNQQISDNTKPYGCVLSPFNVLYWNDWDFDVDLAIPNHFTSQGFISLCSLKSNKKIFKDSNLDKKLAEQRCNIEGKRLCTSLEISEYGKHPICQWIGDNTDPVHFNGTNVLTTGSSDCDYIACCGRTLTWVKRDMYTQCTENIKTDIDANMLGCREYKVSNNPNDAWGGS